MLSELMGEFKGSGVLEGSFSATVTSAGASALGAKPGTAGLTLAAVNNVKARTGARILIECEGSQLPLASVWRSGAARTAVFASLPTEGWMPGLIAPEARELLGAFLSVALGEGMQNARVYLKPQAGTSYLIAEVFADGGEPLSNASVKLVNDKGRAVELVSFDRGKYRTAYPDISEPVSLALEVNGVVRGTFHIEPDLRPEPVASSVDTASLMSFARSIGGRFSATVPEIRRSVPGWVAPLGMLGAVLILLLLSEQLLGIPAVRRRLGNALQR
jgi:hypothetical protein